MQYNNSQPFQTYRCFVLQSFCGIKLHVLKIKTEQLKYMYLLINLKLNIITSSMST